MQVSVIFPVVGSDIQFYLRDSLAQFSHDPRIEVICVDVTSSPILENLCRTHGIHYLRSRSQKRADRLTEGIAAAKGNWIVLHHPRSFLEKDNLLQVLSLDASSPGWGAWTHSFDETSRFYTFASWYSNRVRGDLRGIFYLDHCLFLNRAMIDRAGPNFIPSVEIFEDTLISQRLRRISRPQRLAGKARTSCIRFATNGILRQAVLNQYLKVCFHLKLPDRLLNRQYDGRLKLNGDAEPL
jgi:hypothetical protein